MNPERNDTYTRGEKDFEEQRKRYQQWLSGEDRKLQYHRIAELLGTTVTAVDTKKVHLVIAVLTGSFRPDLQFHVSYTKTIIKAQEYGVKITTVYTAGASHVGKARERALIQAMDVEGATHFLFIDDDMGWEDRLPFRMIAANVDFACAVGVRKEDKPALCCNFYPDGQIIHPVNRFVKVRDVGFAFVLLKRNVIERMREAYPDLAYNAGKNPDGSQKIEYALFLDMIDDRERMSEDYSFCRRWTAIGGEIWADRHARLIHAGRKEYSGAIDDLFEGKEHVQMEVTNG